MTLETTARLRRRIELAEELHSVTGTMKSLAAVTLHQYERSLHPLREYVRTAELGLQILLRSRPETLAADEPSTPQLPALVIVFGSARGLCGPLNRHVARRARQLVDDLPTIDDSTPDPTIVASGERIVGELEAVGLRPEQVIEAPASVEGITTLVEDLLVRIDDWRRTTTGPTRVVLVHPRHEPGTTRYSEVAVPLLPLDRARMRELAAAPWPTNVLPTWRGDWQRTFAAISRELVFVDLHRAVAETQVCVERARLIAMQGAEDNISKRLDELWTRLHRQRQAAITGELLDVISGYEAAGGAEPDTLSRP